MAEKISFKAEIEFKGDIKEFQKLTESLANFEDLSVRIPHWPPDHTVAGCWPLPIERLIDKVALDKIVAGSQRIKFAKFICRTTCGGINNPHIHIRDEIVMLDREKFKEVAGLVAMKLSGEFAMKAEYKDIVGTIRNFMPGAK